MVGLGKYYERICKFIKIKNAIIWAIQQGNTNTMIGLAIIIVMKKWKNIIY